MPDADDSFTGVPTKIRGTRTRKRQVIVETLRNDIVSGAVPLGGRLPSHSEIARRFGASRVTAQWALRHLTQEGFIRSRARSGTFVVDKPPHLNNYALVFFNDPASAYATVPWSRYAMALTNEAVVLQQQNRCRMLMFYGIDEHGDSEDYQRLLSYVEARRLAGIIFTNHPYLVQGSPILDQPDIPRVALMSEQHFPQVSAVTFNCRMWIEKALDHLAARGRKRVAIVAQAETLLDDTWLSQAVAARAMVCPSQWRQVITFSWAPAARNCVHLLLSGPAGERPDGLLIGDDNFTEHALAGLIAAGMRVPADVDVVTHCNFPWPPPAVLPVTRLGFDIRGTLRTAMDLIDRQRRGETVPGLTRMPALFEQELNSQSVAELPAAASVALTATTTT